jgi:predicted DNA-binding transcriptional regulator AlpA
MSVKRWQRIGGQAEVIQSAAEEGKVQWAEEPSQLMPQRLLKPSSAYEMCGGISPSTARRLIAAGRFPTPIVLARDRHGRPVRVAYVYTELLSWIATHISANRPQSSRSGGPEPRSAYR